MQPSTFQELVKGELVLPKEVTIVDSETLPEDIKEKLEVKEGDKLLSKSFSRETSKVINGELAAILSLFETPKSIIAVVREYAKEHQENSEALLDSFFEPMMDIIQKGFLVSKESAEEENKGLSYHDSFQDYTIVYKVYQTEDTELYLAQDKKERFVALKVAVAKNMKSIIPILEHEVDILQQLSSNVTPKYIESNLEHSSPYIVTEWIHGVSVIQYAKKLRTEHNDKALVSLLGNITRAYDQLHKEGWLHQDIHPGNIMCDKDGNVTLIDFGLSQKIDYPYQVRAGVQFYIAPESIEINNLTKTNANILSEQYSIAAVLYELFTGTEYCNFSLRTETMFEQIKTELPRKFEALGKQAFPALEKVFEKALAKKPEDRFETLEQMYIAIEEVQFHNIQNDDSEVLRNEFSLQLLKEFDVSKPLYNKGLPHGPLSSVYYGAAGIAYALYRFSIVEDSAYYLSLSEKWLQMAFNYLEEDQAFSNPSFENEDDPVTDYSTFNHLPGLYGVQAFISYAKGDFYRLNESIAFILKLTEASEENNDLTLDGLGVALLLLNILELNNYHIDKALHKEMEKRIEKIVIPNIQGGGIFKQFTLEPTITNLGIAHGIGGHVYVLSRWYKYKKIVPNQYFFNGLKAIVRNEVPQGCGVAIPWQTTQSKTLFHTMSGWCNGSAGILMLLCEVSTLHHQKQYLKDAEKFAWHCWEDTASVPHLCCGLAGRAYALAYYSQVTKNEVWHERALKLLSQAIEYHNTYDDTEETPMHSLFKGQLGVALALKELKTHGVYEMPFFGREK